MKISFLDGRIIADGYLYEDVPYDVSANNLSVCFDGKGGLSKFLSVRSEKNYAPRSMTSFYKNGERIGAYTKKRVKMVGRTQEICLYGDHYCVEIKQFITKSDNAVFVEMVVSADEQMDFELAYGVGTSWVIPTFSCDTNCTFIEENMYFRIPFCVVGKKRVRFVVDYEGNQSYCDWLLSVFDERIQQAYGEIENVKIPASVKTEEEKALYLSALFCSLENYKECGGLKGFVAGCHYLNPLRTY